MTNPMSLAVICDSKEQREHALTVAKSNGIAYGDWYRKTDRGNILRVYQKTGDWNFLNWNGGAETVLTYDEFITKYGGQAEQQKKQQ